MAVVLFCFFCLWKLDGHRYESYREDNEMTRTNTARKNMTAEMMKDLFRRMKTGDERALEEFYAVMDPRRESEYKYSKLYGVIVSELNRHGNFSSYSDDVLYETLEKVYLKCNSLRKEEAWESWMIGIAKNTCKEVLRNNNEEVKTGKLVIHPVSDDDKELIENISDNRETPEEYVMNKALWEVIDQKVKEEYGVKIYSVYKLMKEGLSTNEIASRLGIKNQCTYKRQDLLRMALNDIGKEVR